MSDTFATINFVDRAGVIHSTHVDEATKLDGIILSELRRFGFNNRSSVAEQIFGHVANYKHIKRIESTTDASGYGDRIPGTDLSIFGQPTSSGETSTVLGRIRTEKLNDGDYEQIYNQPVGDRAASVIYDERAPEWLTFFWNDHDEEHYEVVGHRSVKLADLRRNFR